MKVQSKAYPRAAIVGNPSDGYYGKTIAFVFGEFLAETSLTEAEKLQIVPELGEILTYQSWTDLLTDIQQHGYNEVNRLIQATLKRFTRYCLENSLPLPSQNFMIEYRSDVPLQLGLGGSSAIICSLLRCLIAYHKVKIDKEHLANLVFSVEKDELSIGGGLQDRVTQVYESPVYMDFSEEIMKRQGFGDYRTFSKKLLPPFYIAFRDTLSQSSDQIHNDLGERFNSGDADVRQAMKEFAKITDRAMSALIDGHPELLGDLMNRNFDLRASILNISPSNMEMIKLARKEGASAKFTGSGGAIVGTYKDQEMYARLESTLMNYSIRVLKPTIIDHAGA